MQECEDFQSDFVVLILACKSGFEYNYAFRFDDRVPEHLRLNESDRIALEANGLGPTKDKAKTAVNKFFKHLKKESFVLHTCFIQMI